MYSSFPPVPDSWKDMKFEEYAKNVCIREGFPHVPQNRIETILEEGRNKLREIRALSSIRSLFARVLEVWINADRALWLCERGYSVELGICMPQQVSPRNIVIRAKR